MRRTAVLVLFVVVIAFAVTFPAAADESCGCTFQVGTLNHTQTLGGNAGAAHQGLHQAADHSRVVQHIPV